MIKCYNYGLPKAKSTGAEVNPFKYGGKELTTDMRTPFYDFEARVQLPTLGLFGRPDPKAGDFQWLNTYSYCGADPVNRVDPDGKWNINVSASSDRGKHPYAIFTVYDRKDNIVFKTVVRVTGTSRNRAVEKADTPQGDYDILEWRDTGNERYKAESFGPDFLLATNYKGGEGGNRNGMHVHGGRQQGPELTGTWGCIRISNEDILEMRKITDNLENNDPEEKKGIMTVIDDLETPVHFKDRNEIKYNWIRVGGELPELIVKFKKE